jgi:hypothetical protein
MVDTLVKYGVPYIKQIRVVDTKDMAYGNGAAWGPSMLKLGAVHQMLKDYDIQDNDFILSVDSDVVFCTPDLFSVIDDQYGIIGVQHKPPYETKYGPFGHMSGALIFLRGDIAKLMCAISEGELNRIRMEEFKGYVIVENEDVVLSYLAMICGAKPFDLPGWLSSGNFEEDIVAGTLRSYYHLNYCPTVFLGEPVTGKWDLALVLQSKGIEL